MRYCSNCDLEYPNSTKTCPECGQPMEKVNKKFNIGKLVETSTRKIQDFAVYSAASTPGETMLAQKLPSAVIGDFNLDEKTLGPIKLIINNLKNVKTNITALKEDKKKLFLVLALSLIWFLLTLLPGIGINPLPIKVLSFLTFAQGGMTNSIIGMLGGVLGKTVFAIFVLDMVDGKNPLDKIKDMIVDFKNRFKLEGEKKFPTFLLGVSSSLLAFNFMVLYSSPWSFMAGLAATYISARALKGGFLKDLIRAFGSKISSFMKKTTDNYFEKNKDKGGFLAKVFTVIQAKSRNKSQSKSINNLQLGMTAGFALSTILSLASKFFKFDFIGREVEFGGYLPLILGILILLISAIWFIISFVLELVKGGSKDEKLQINI